MKSARDDITRKRRTAALAGAATAAADVYRFDGVAVRVRRHAGVWHLTPHGQTLGEGMAAAAKCLTDKLALDVGTGTGVHAIAALKLGARAIDVTDIDPAAIRCSLENAALNNVAFRDARVRNWLHFRPDEPYDVVLCNPPFCRAGTPDRRYFIRELIRGSARVLREGGRLLFVQSSMADFRTSEAELKTEGFRASVLCESRFLFRPYYFSEPGFIAESARLANGFELVDGRFVETLRVYLCTKR